MIYSIGYQHMRTPGDLVRHLKANNICYLLDVRSRPYGRKAAFNKEFLRTYLAEHGITYFWQGRKLGGFSVIEEHSIKLVAEFEQDRTICLMCMEADPDQCHRKYEIARRLEKYGITVHHIKT